MYTGKVKGYARIKNSEVRRLNKPTSLDMSHVPVIENGEKVVDKYGRQVWRKAYRPTIRQVDTKYYFVEHIDCPEPFAEFMTKKEIMSFYGKKTGRKLIRDFEGAASNV